MTRIWVFALTFLIFGASLTHAQEYLSPEVQAVINTPLDTNTDASAPTPEAPAPAPEPTPPKYEDTPQVELRILDKVRAESRAYVLSVGRTVAYGNIRIRPRACRKSSPLDDPENAAFLQIWEVKPDGTSAWVFSGWMFASSPSLSAMDHPVYDVSVLDCRTPAKATESVTKAEPAPENDTSESDSADAKSE